MKRVLEETTVFVVFYYRDYRKENDGDVIGVFAKKEDAFEFRKKTFLDGDMTLCKGQSFDDEGFIYEEEGKEETYDVYGIKEMPLL